jgi:predicted secreted Zn-dependent protease
VLLEKKSTITVIIIVKAIAPRVKNNDDSDKTVAVFWAKKIDNANTPLEKHDNAGKHIVSSVSLALGVPISSFFPHFIY